MDTDRIQQLEDRIKALEEQMAKLMNPSAADRAAAAFETAKRLEGL